MDPGVLIVGGGQAACQLAGALRQMGFLGAVTMVGDEELLPYHRPPLSKTFLKDAQLPSVTFVRQPQFFATTGCQVHLKMRVVKVDRTRQTVTLNDGRQLRYDRLVLATGARPRPLPDHLHDGVDVRYLRTVDDAIAIREGLRPGQRLAILGGGYIGLEVAAAAVQRDVYVDVFEASDRVMQRSVSPGLSSIMQDLHQRHGVRLHLGAAVRRIRRRGPDTDGGVELHLDNMDPLVADILVAGIGAQPNIELAQQAGLQCGQAIHVNRSCQTSDPAIYAIGDCTEQVESRYGANLRLESVQNAVEQANCAAAAIAGRPPVPVGVPWFWSDQFGHRLQVAGLLQDHDQEVVRRSADEDSGQLTQSIWHLRRGVAVAVETIDAPADFMAAKLAIHNRWQLDPMQLANASVPVSGARIEQ